MFLNLNATLPDHPQIDGAQQSNRKKHGAKIPRLSYTQVIDDSSVENLRDCTTTFEALGAFVK
ncbi:uncharacterized protein Bfra_006507 [Botrytis fragariae]|uniref:Uncharacterized protein n=1 Tax=Botrytis fragariae TaxID=1964551 RepID=A0A8H6ENX0_9HELO|nr:uncharacterized protein Bfra_006507 [Botrytis fragariae]KAF5879301.1 hypothetical protein Bfra_006507 [Botrytis fragariae]